MSDGADTDDGAQNPAVSVLQSVTPEFIRKSFAIKFGLVLLIMALSIGAIGVAATQVITDQTESNVESEFLGDAQQQADIIEQWLETNRLQTQLLSENVSTGDNLDSELSRQQRELSSDLVHAHVIDDDETEGPVVVAGTDSDLGRDLSDSERDWFVDPNNVNTIFDLEATEVYVSDTYTVGNDNVVGFVSPVSEAEDRYLFLEISVEEVQQSLRGSEDDDVGFTQAVNTGAYQTDDGDENLVMIDARGSNGKLFEAYAGDGDEALRVLDQANELRSSDETAGVEQEMPANSEVIDEVYTVGYSPVENSDWVVVTHGPRSSVFGFVDTLSTWGLIVTLFSVLLIGVTGSVLGYSTATSIDRLTSKTDEIREGDLDVALHSSRIDNIGRLYDGFDDMRDALKTQIQEAEQARKEAEVARAEAEELADYLQDKAEEYSEVMQQVSAGDMTQRMEQDGEEDSMDQIAEEFNDMIEELEKTTGQLKSYVDEVEAAGAEVESSAATVREASEQVADSIQKISDDAYDQKDRLDELTMVMDSLADDIESIAEEYDDIDMSDSLDQIREASTQLDELTDLSQETMAEAEEVAGAAEEQAAELNAVSDRANELQRYAQPLRDILERFETEAEHEFVFSVGPTGGAASPSSQDDDE
ncbi:HAMP domain-containing protein [Halovenus sp. HT40]|uniref:HAMP domain-containing protein n=1 Tax=Halovenus sp. HT40 TaxID=3126691 RepID=UPI00300EF219